MMIPGPIEQNAYGKGGIYECLHIQKKSMTVKEYRRKIECFEQITNGLKPEEVEDMVLAIPYAVLEKHLVQSPIIRCRYQAVLHGRICRGLESGGVALSADDGS